MSKEWLYSIDLLLWHPTRGSYWVRAEHIPPQNIRVVYQTAQAACAESGALAYKVVPTWKHSPYDR